MADFTCTPGQKIPVQDLLDFIVGAWTGGTYDEDTGIVEFTSDNGLGFQTEDLRGEDAPMFYLVSSFTPTLAQEYPTVVDEDYGAFWYVDGLTSPYTFTAGDLVGQTIENNQSMTIGQNGWMILNSRLESNEYYRVDGSNKLEADMDTDGFKLTNLKDAELNQDATTLKQVQTIVSNSVELGSY